jgi:cytochrome bd ubiquinol oxidase subunit II
VTSWLNPACVLIGALAVAFCGYLAAVYLAADSLRAGGGEGGDAGAAAGAGAALATDDGNRALAGAFRRRALAAGLVAGGLALAGLLVMRRSGLNLTHGVALVLVCVSAAAGLATLLLCWRNRFGPARVTAALAVAAVVVGWAAGQAPRFLPGLTVTQAAASRSTLLALIVAVGCGAVVLVPSLGLLYGLYLRGLLNTPEGPGSGVTELGAADVTEPGTAGFSRRSRSPAARLAANAARTADEAFGPQAGTRVRVWGVAAVVGLAGGTGLLVFADPNWAHLAGVACLVLCAVAVFLLAAPRDE